MPRRKVGVETRHERTLAKQLAPVYGQLYERTAQDPAFRAADNAPFETITDVVDMNDDAIEEHAAAKAEAKAVIFDALLTHRKETTPELNWEMRRLASLKQMTGVALGSFGTYFTQLESSAESTGVGSGDLPPGESEVVFTNERVVSANRHYSEPLEYLDVAISQIDRRKSQGRYNIGPENYSTAVKFFADKYRALDNPPEEISLEDIKPLVDDVMQGFVEISKLDEPNILEMTNIYSAVKTLPSGAVDEKFTQPLLMHSLKTLPDFSIKTVNVFLGALPKLDLSQPENGEAAAQLIDLALRKSKTFMNTYDFRVALRAIAVLPKSEASEQALRSFLEYRNDLEQSLDLDGAEEVNYRLLQITENVITSDDLNVQVKTLAEHVARTASDVSKRYFLDGGLTKDQAEHVKKTFANIMTNYKAI